MQKVIEQNEKNRLGQGGMLGNWAGRPREEMLSLANSAQNESTISNDLDDILPRYKQYTGEVPALHDIDQGNSRVQGFDPRLKITRLKPGESHKYQKLVKMEEERKLKRNEGQKVD